MNLGIVLIISAIGLAGFLFLCHKKPEIPAKIFLTRDGNPIARIHSWSDFVQEAKLFCVDKSPYAGLILFLLLLIYLHP